jgi:colanic acid/amylovoran biosynthesis glycosyltransferase
VHAVDPVIQSTHSWLPTTEVWLANQVRHLPDWIESHVVCATRANRSEFPFPRVHAAQERPVRHARDRALRRVMARPLGPLSAVARRTGAHVVHSHFGPTGWFDSRTVSRLGARHVISFYGEDASRLPREQPRWRRRYAAMFGNAAAVLCEGPYMAGTITDLGCEPGKVVVHRLGVDLEALPSFRPRSWTASRPLRVLLAGSFREKKGIPDAVEALGILSREGLDLTATLIGDARPDDDQSEKRRILAAIARNRLGDRVRLLGYQPHERLLAEAEAHDVFLSPSRTAGNGDNEGGAPVTIIEMAAMGLPILSTRHCDIPSVLGASNRALLAPEGDPHALVDAFAAMVDEDWTALAGENRSLIERELDCGAQGEKLARIYFPDAA